MTSGPYDELDAPEDDQERLDLGALRRADGDPAFVQARHEENAALMASGHAKYTDGVGVVGSPATSP